MLRTGRFRSVREAVRDLPAFREFRRLARETTGFRIGLIDLERRSKPMDLAHRPRRSWRFCDLVRSTPEGTARCDASDRLGIRACARAGRAVAYTCHAGLTEVIAPLHVRGEFVACVNCGQALLERPSDALFAGVLARLEGLPIDRRLLRRAFGRLRVASMRQIEAVGRLLGLVARYVAEAELPARNAPRARRASPEDRAAAFLAYAENAAAVTAGEVPGALARVMQRLTAQIAARGGRNPAAIARGLEHILRHYREALPMANVARAAGLSTYYFGRCFREAVGLSVSAFANRLRAARARALLAATDADVSAVAREVGFADPFYFARVFRRSSGASPSAYRRRARKRR